MHSKYPLLLLLALTLLLVTVLGAGRDFYKILGVKKDASEAQLKKAYKKAALKYHPDRVQDESKKEEAQKKFMDVSAAYETLSDPEKKRIYDQVGEEGLARGGGGGGGGGAQPDGHPGFGGGGGGGFPGGSSFQFHTSSGGGGGMPQYSNPFNMFETMFGGGPGRRRHPGQGQGPAPPLYVGPEFVDVEKVTRGTFKSSLSREARGDEVVVLQYYSNSEATARKFSSVFGKLATALRGVARFAAVDCAAESALCAAQHVDAASAPVYRILTRDGSEPFEGQPTAPNLRNAVLAAVQRYAVVRTVSGDGTGSRARIDSLLRRFGGGAAAAAHPGEPAAAAAASHNATLGSVLLFSERKEPPSLFAALSARRDIAGPGGLTFVFVPMSSVNDAHDAQWSDSVAHDLGVDSLPALAIVHGSSWADVRDGARWADVRDIKSASVPLQGARLYDGTLRGDPDVKALRRWIEAHLAAVRARLAPPRVSAATRAKPAPGSKPPAAATAAAGAKSKAGGSDEKSSATVRQQQQQRRPGGVREASVVDLATCLGLRLSDVVGALPSWASSALQAMGLASKADADDGVTASRTCAVVLSPDAGSDDRVASAAQRLSRALAKQPAAGGLDVFTLSFVEPSGSGVLGKLASFMGGGTNGMMHRVTRALGEWEYSRLEGHSAEAAVTNSPKLLLLKRRKGRARGASVAVSHWRGDWDDASREFEDAIERSVSGDLPLSDATPSLQDIQRVVIAFLEQQGGGEGESDRSSNSAGDL